MKPITVYFPGLEQTFGPFDPPSSTEDSIIFPFNLSSKGFSRGTYSAKLTLGRASVDDINQVLTLVELVLLRLESTREVIINFLLRIFIPLLLIIYSWEVYLFCSSVLEILSPIYVIYIQWLRISRKSFAIKCTHFSLKAQNALTFSKKRKSQ